MRQPLAGRDTGVVDQAVDPPRTRAQPVGQRRPAVGVGDVEVRVLHVEALTRQPLGQQRAVLVEDVGRQDGRPGPGQRLDLGRALAPGAAGDDDDLAGQVGHQTGGATKRPLSGSLKESRAMISDIGSAVPHWSCVIGSAMS